MSYLRKPCITRTVLSLSSNSTVSVLNPTYFCYCSYYVFVVNMIYNYMDMLMVRYLLMWRYRMRNAQRQSVKTPLGSELFCLLLSNGKGAH